MPPWSKAAKQAEAKLKAKQHKRLQSHLRLIRAKRRLREIRKQKETTRTPTRLRSPVRPPSRRQPQPKSEQDNTQNDKEWCEQFLRNIRRQRGRPTPPAATQDTSPPHPWEQPPQDTPPQHPWEQPMTSWERNVLGKRQRWLYQNP